MGVKFIPRTMNITAINKYFEGIAFAEPMGKNAIKIKVSHQVMDNDYIIKIIYSQYEKIKIFLIDSHDNKIIPSDDTPHLYRDSSLCLYYFNEWHEGMAMYDTIMPWIIEWLINYEQYPRTKKWMGKEIEHNDRDIPK